MKKQKRINFYISLDSKEEKRINKVRKHYSLVDIFIDGVSSCESKIQQQKDHERESK